MLPYGHKWSQAPLRTALHEKVFDCNPGQYGAGMKMAELFFKIFGFGCGATHGKPMHCGRLAHAQRFEQEICPISDMFERGDRQCDVKRVVRKGEVGGVQIVNNIGIGHAAAQEMQHFPHPTHVEGRLRTKAFYDIGHTPMNICGNNMDCVHGATLETPYQLSSLRVSQNGYLKYATPSTNLNAGIASSQWFENSLILIANNSQGAQLMVIVNLVFCPVAGVYDLDVNRNMRCE